VFLLQPVSVKAAVSGIFLALEKVRGLIHLGGIERISRYDFGMPLMNMLNIQKAKLSPCGQRDVVMPASRPPDVSLDSTKAFANGFQTLPLAEELKALRGIV
jgi:dTDP-4-dehydrorhamnose reductase